MSCVIGCFFIYISQCDHPTSPLPYRFQFNHRFLMWVTRIIYNISDEDIWYSTVCNSASTSLSLLEIPWLMHLTVAFTFFMDASHWQFSVILSLTSSLQSFTTDELPFYCIITFHPFPVIPIHKIFHLFLYDCLWMPHDSIWYQNQAQLFWNQRLYRE